MSLVVVATPGAVNANSFQTVAEIDAYYAARVPAATASQWIDADATDKDAAAVFATTIMTALIDWTGYPAVINQTLPWPRNSMLKRDGYSFVPNNIIPQELKNAHAELARCLLIEDRTVELPQTVQGLAGFQAGHIKVQFRDPSGRGSPAPPPPTMPSYIVSLLVDSWIEAVNDGDPSVLELMRA